MHITNKLISLIIFIFTLGRTANGDVLDGSGSLEQNIRHIFSNSALQRQSKQVKDIANKWSFFSDSTLTTVPNRKPIPQFGKPPKPKPNNPVSPQVWSWNNDDKGWNAMGWVNMQTTCMSTVTTTGIELTKTTVTSTETTSLTEYETVTNVSPPVTITVTPTPSFGWAFTTTVTETDFTTAVIWETEVAIAEITSTVLEYETSVISTTKTETINSIVSSTSTFYINVTSTTFLTSSTILTDTSTTDLGWGNVDATIVLEPSVLLYHIVSTITSTLSETPTLTVHSTIQTTVTTDYEIVTEFVTLPFATTPPVTITEFVETWLDTTIDTITLTILTSRPECTVTKYEYMSTVTTPIRTITASYCGNPCWANDKCFQVCYPKISTTYLDVTSTAVVTAAQPLVITYSATETVSTFTFEESILLTTRTLAQRGVATTTTVTSTSNAPVESSTDTMKLTITSVNPVTITTTENLCTTVLYETCTTTVKLPPVYVVITDTAVIGVVGTIQQTSTSFTVPPIPTVTSYIQGGINALTATETEVIVTDSRAVTTTITENATTIGYGDVTITPTTTFLNTKTAGVTSTPVTNLTNIKKRTLIAEEYTTNVEETLESFIIAPSITDYVLVEITPTPLMVTVSTLVMQLETTPSSGWR